MKEAECSKRRETYNIRFKWKLKENKVTERKEKEKKCE